MKKELNHTSFIKLYNYCLTLMVHTALLFEEDDSYKEVYIQKAPASTIVKSNFKDVLRNWSIKTHSDKVSYAFFVTYTNRFLKGNSKTLTIKIIHQKNHDYFYTELLPLNNITHTINLKFIDKKKPEEVAREIYKESVALQDHYIEQIKGQDS